MMGFSILLLFCLISIKPYICIVIHVDSEEFQSDAIQENYLGRWLSFNNSYQSDCLNLPHIRKTPTAIYRNLWDSSKIPSSRFPNGYKLDYSCLQGFPSRVSLVCSAGSWVWVNGLFCRPRQCFNPPPNIEGGRWRVQLSHDSVVWRSAHPHATEVIPKPQMESDRVTYECLAPGDRVLGSPTSFCVGVPGHSTLARWSEPLPVCLLHAQYCALPRIPNVAHIDCVTPYCDDFFNGTEVLVQCLVGFRLIGASTLKCYVSPGIDRRSYWLPHAPRCESYESISDTLKRVSGSFQLGTNYPVTIVIIVVSCCFITLVTVTVTLLLCRRCPTRTNAVPARDISASSDCVALILPPQPPTYEEAVENGGLDPTASTVSTLQNNSIPLVDTSLFTCMQRSVSSIRDWHSSTCLLPPSYQPRAYSQQICTNLLVGSIPDAISSNSVNGSGCQSETITVSGDSTSITLNTYELACGSNPSIGSTIPLTGSFPYEDSSSPKELPTGEVPA